MQIRAFPETDLDAVMAAVDSAFARFEREGVPAEELERVKARNETAFYDGLSCVFGKAFRLAQYDIFAHNAGFLTEDLAPHAGRHRSGREASLRDLHQGPAERGDSFVPAGQASSRSRARSGPRWSKSRSFRARASSLTRPRRGRAHALPRSTAAREPPSARADPARAHGPRTRSQRPRVLGIEDRELPLVQFELRIKGGQLLDDAGHLGVANLLAETMTEGTAAEDARRAGAGHRLAGRVHRRHRRPRKLLDQRQSLARNFAATMALVEEILLEPR